MKSSLILCAPTVLVFCSVAGAQQGAVSEAPAKHGTALLAATPPMGWNSWDGFGTTINEAQFKENAQWLAKHLKPYGWQYVVVDMEWFVTNPAPEGNSKNSTFSMDEFGRYTADVNRFPSSANGAGFKPLADYVHSLGLRFGIHILRGIPKQAVEKNLPIAGSSFHAADAADTSETCPWNPDNYGVDSAKPGAQAYYNSIAAPYAKWGVDFIKVDCVSSRPYRGEEIRMISTALRKTGRPIVLSLSPGAAPVEKSGEMAKYAQMWRISDDIWDLWHSTVHYPQGVGDQFVNVARWAELSTPGHWPDADMLPFGYLGPAPGWGKPRYTRLTHDEQRTMFSLWCIFHSPLMVGGNLPQADEWTIGLLTNREVLAIDQHAGAGRPVVTTDKEVIWLASSPAKGSYYVAAFNIGDAQEAIQHSWKDLNLPAGEYTIRDLWEHKDLGAAKGLNATVPVHACVLYRLTPVARAAR